MEHIKAKKIHEWYAWDPHHVIMDAEIRDDIPPIGCYIIYAIGKLTGFLLNREWMEEIGTEHGP
jgi:hypothetical protein